MEQQVIPGLAIAPSAICVSAAYDWRSGWSFRLSWRASGSDGFSHRDYDGLTGPELVDVLSSELERLALPSSTVASAEGGGAG